MTKAGPISTEFFKRQIALLGVREAFLALEASLTRSPLHVAAFCDLARIFRKEHPEELLALSERLLARRHDDKIALAAASLAHAVGNPKRARQLLERVDPANPKRGKLEMRWRDEEAWTQADLAVRRNPGLASALNRDGAFGAVLFRDFCRHLSLPEAVEKLLKSTIRFAELEAQGGFYERALTRLDRTRELAAAMLPEACERLTPLLARATAVRDDIDASLRWLHREIPGPWTSWASPQSGPKPATPRTVLYLTFGSLPFRTNGNAVRTHGLLSTIAASGWDMRAITRPGFPQALPAAIDERLDKIAPLSEGEYSYRLDGVAYTNWRVADAKNWKLNLQKQFDFWVEATLAMARRDKPALIHGASNHLIGAAAIHAAERLGLPSIYEMRGMWALDHGAADPDFASTREAERMACLEVEIAQRATHLFAISPGIRDFLLARGIGGEKISLLPNGIDLTRFTPGPPDEALRKRLGLQGRTVIGFLGSFAGYEGIGILLEAVRLLIDRGHGKKIALLLIGDGRERNAVLKRAGELRLDGTVTHLPPVPFEAAPGYLRLMEIVVNPRLPLPICELVTPIKPLEAMAMGRTVIVSDVGGLTGVVTHGITGLVHRKGDPASLADTVEIALRDKGLRERLGGDAREFVVQNHDWRKVARQSVLPVYERLAAEGRRPA